MGRVEATVTRQDLKMHAILASTHDVGTVEAASSSTADTTIAVGPRAAAAAMIHEAEAAIELNEIDIALSALDGAYGRRTGGTLWCTLEESTSLLRPRGRRWQAALPLRRTASRVALSLLGAHEQWSQAPGDSSVTGLGGVCFGDSGGPAFLGDTTTIAAVTSSGDQACAGSSVAYRLDTPAARQFLGQYVLLP